MNLYPLLVEPILVEKIWGGEKLKEYNKKINSGEKIGESWEISCFPGRISKIKSGPYKDNYLDKIIALDPELFLGKKVVEKHGNILPLLLKLLYANDKLSVQVHPGDDYIKKTGRNDIKSKTEAWLILDAQPDSWIAYGVKEGINKNEFLSLIKENKIEDVINYIPVSPGDIIPILPGTLHSIGPKVLILELQQSSDTTFRFYDYERAGLDGKPRPIHLKEASEVVNLDNKLKLLKPQLCNIETDKDKIINKRELLFKNDILRMERWECNGKINLPYEDNFSIATILEGSFSLSQKFDDINLIKGDSFFIPANLQVTIEGSGKIFIGSIGE